jgi:anti-sigma factor RsiW
MEVNKNNIEEQILLYVDGELNTEEAKALLQYVAQHPEWRTLLDEYSNLVLQPDTDMVFEGKEALLQPEVQTIAFVKKGNSLKSLRWAAAAVLVIGAAGLAWMFSRSDQGDALPDHTTIAMQPVQIPAATPNITKDTVGVMPVQPAAIASNNKIAHKTAAQTILVHTPQPVQEIQRKEEQLAPIAGNTLALNDTKAQPLPAAEMQRPETLQTLQQEQQVAVNTESLPSWLPVSGDKLDGVNDLVSHIREVKEKVAAKAAILKKSTFVIRLGEKEIAFGK